MSGQPEEEDPRLSQLRRRYEELLEAHEARGRLLARQRWQFADRLKDETEDRDRELEQLRVEVKGLREEVEGKQAELDRLLSTRTFRYTAALRRLWGRARGR